MALIEIDGLPNLKIVIFHGKLLNNHMVSYMGVCIVMTVPQNTWFMKENPSYKWMIWKPRYSKIIDLETTYINISIIFFIISIYWVCYFF